MSNTQRVTLGEGVAEIVAEADPATAFEVLEAAYSIQMRKQREMTLDEALVIIRQVSEQVEALGA